MTVMSEETRSKAEQYNAVVAKARLLDVMLTSSNFSVAHGFRGNEGDAAKFLDEACDAPSYLIEDHMVFGEVRFRVWMAEQGDDLSKHKDGEAFFKASPLQIEANYIVAFDLPGEHDEDNVVSFFQRTAAFTAWPYFRAIIAQFSAASEVEIPILPIKQLSVPFRTGAGYAGTPENESKNESDAQNTD
jgi:hypothetical protein